MANRFLTPKKNLDGSRQLRAKEVQSGTDIKAGAGLVITNGTIGHSNSVTAGTNNRIRCGAMDSEGHFTGSQTEYEVTTSIDTDHPSDTKLPTEKAVKEHTSWGNIIGDIEDQEDLQDALNGRAKTDLSNVNASQSAKSEIVSWGMPDYTAKISITSPYVAPKNGYILYNHTANQAQAPTIDGVDLDSRPSAGLNYDSLFVMYPISKSSVFVFQQNSANFIPCKGEL